MFIDKKLQAIKNRSCMNIKSGRVMMEVKDRDWLFAIIENLKAQIKVENGYCIVCGDDGSKVKNGAVYCSDCWKEFQQLINPNKYDDETIEKIKQKILANRG